MDIETPWIKNDAVNQRMDQFQERMGNLENALHQILMHLTPEIPAHHPGTTEVPVIPLDTEFDDPWNSLEDN